jgi:tungstate transport system ATP-binding protein
MGDEIVHVHNGKLIEVASPREFFENPRSEITRKFINGELEF